MTGWFFFVMEVSENMEYYLSPMATFGKIGAEAVVLWETHVQNPKMTRTYHDHAWFNGRWVPG